MSESAAARVARYVTYGVLSGWLTITFLSQDPRRKFNAPRRLDPTGALIPDWRFFAPRPGVNDYHLLARDELPGGLFTDWTEVCNVEKRSWTHSFWYPSRRAEKVLTDAAAGLQAMLPKLKDRENVLVSIPYLTLLNYVTNQVRHHPEAKRVQFLVATSAGYDDSEKPSPMFLSKLHLLG